MVLAFFKGGSGEGDFDHIVAKAVSMLGDARHSFDLASLVLLTDADADSVADDVRETDERIDMTEQELRSELVVHVSVKGTADIGSVLGFTLLLKKIERIGDQAKNILELAETGLSFASIAEAEELLAERQTVSALFGEAAELLAAPNPDRAAIDDYAVRANEVYETYQARINECMNSERPGREVVPLAIYFRSLRRIAANLVGAVRDSSEPIPSVVDDGMDDEN